MRTRDRVTAVVAVAALVLAAAGCVRSERSLSLTASRDCPVGALDELDAGDTVELELWHALNAEAKTTLEELAASYNDSQDRVRVVVRSQGTTYDEVLDAYTQGIASGDLPGLAHMDAKDLRVLIDTATLLPAQACFDAEGTEPDVIPSVRAAFTVNDLYWTALPTVSSTILYYSQTDFQNAGLDPADPPGTLDELTEAARALKESGVDRPLALLLAYGTIIGWNLGAGNQLLDQNDGRDGLATAAEFDTPAIRKAFEWIKMMVDEGLAQPFSSGGIDQFLAVATRTSSMVMETSTASTTIAEFLGGGDVDTGGVAVPGGDLDLSQINPAAGPFPGIDEPGQVEIGGGAFFIPGTSAPEVQAAAWDFTQYMASPEGQLRWHMDGGYLPVAQGLDEDPTIQEFWDSTLAGSLLRVGATQTFEVSPDNPGPVTGPSSDVAQIIEAAMGKVAFQGGSVDDAVRTADREIDAALARYVEDNE